MVEAGTEDDARDEGGGRLLNLIDRLEEYSAHHPESVEELLDWSASKFEAFWEAYAKRKAIEGLDEYRTAMLTALHANSNIEDEARQNTLESIDARIAELTHKIQFGSDDEEQEEVIEEAETFKQEQWW